MKKIRTFIALLMFFVAAPLAVFAMSHQDHADHGQGRAVDVDHHEDMKHGDHSGTKEEQLGHSGMSSDGAMMIVGSMVSKGVKGVAHLKDISVLSAEMGLKATHHFMIAFIDESTGELIDTGSVALKVTTPNAKVGDPIELVGMDGHFGADVVLDMKGEYHLRLGTKLADGTKRKYHFHHVVE